MTYFIRSNTDMKVKAAPKRSVPISLSILLGSGMIIGLVIVMHMALSVYPYADHRLSISDNLKKLTLIHATMAQPETIKGLTRDELAILLRQPQINKNERVVTSWHYHGEACAIDIYFSQDAEKPDYIEFRPLMLNNDVQARFEQTSDTTNRYCLKDVLEAQGVDTPSSFARQPLPSYDNPYRT
jgi:hypothetical protein